MFKDGTRLSDGSAVVTVNALRATTFSYGEVRLLNGQDTALLVEADRKAAREAASGTGETGTDDNG